MIRQYILPWGYEQRQGEKRWLLLGKIEIEEVTILRFEKSLFHGREVFGRNGKILNKSIELQHFYARTKD